LDSCQIFSNGRQGILIWNGAGSFEAVKYEVHTNKHESGITVMENKPHEASFSQCKVYSNGVAGIAVQDKGLARIEECKIYDNNDGVLIQGTSTAHVQDCDVKNNGSNGIFVGFDHKSGRVNIRNNRLQDNQTMGLFLGPGVTENVAAEGNTESGNLGLPCCNPSSVIFKRLANPGGEVNPQLRQWAKRIQKNHSENAFSNAILGCGFCGKLPAKSEKFDKCSRCMAVVYCSKECHKKGWKAGHKKVCNPTKVKHPSFVEPGESV
jgi:hypothetical protein